MTRPTRSTHGRRRAPARDGHRLGGRARGRRGRLRDRPRRSDPGRCRQASRVRRVGDARGALGALGATRCRPAFEGRAGIDAPSGDRPRSPMPVPRVRSTPHVVRRAPHRALGRRRLDRALEPDPALPSTPPCDPRRPSTPGDGRRPAGVPTTRRLVPRTSSPVSARRPYLGVNAPSAPQGADPRTAATCGAAAYTAPRSGESPATTSRMIPAASARSASAASRPSRGRTASASAARLCQR